MKKYLRDLKKFFLVFQKPISTFLKNNKIIVLFTLLVIAHRLIIIIYSKLSFYSDDAIYAEMARFWIEKQYYLVFHPTWPPLYPAISAFIYALFRNWEFSLRLVSALSGSFLAIPIYFLFLRKFNKSWSAIFTLLILFSSPIIKMSVYPQSDMLATLFITSGLTALVYKQTYLGALFIGLTYLTRAEGLMFFILSLPFVAYLKNLKKLLIYILIFIVVISPYWIAIKIKSGSWSLSQKSSAQIKQGESFLLNSENTTWSQEIVSVKSPNYKSAYFTGGGSYVLEYSDWFVFLFKQRLAAWKHVFTKYFTEWSVPIILIGSSSILLIYTLIFSVTATIFATPIADERYLVWAFIILLYFLIAGAARLKIPPIIIFTVLIFFPFLNSSNIFNPVAYAQNFTVNYFRPEIISAGNWLSKNHKNATVLMRHEGVEFYANGRTIYTPQGLSITDTLNYARSKEVDYVVAWTEELQNDKILFPLLNPKLLFENLKVVYSYPSDDPKIVIYRLD